MDLLNEPTYCTLDEVKDTSDKLNSKTDTELNRLMTACQYIIDDAITAIPAPREDEDQSFVFPLEEIGIPRDIKLATIFLMENYDTMDGKEWWKIQTEKLGYYSVTYAEAKEQDLIDDRVERYLRPYMTNFYKQKMR